MSVSAVVNYLCRALHHGTYFTGEFVVILNAFADARNPAAHGGMVDRAEVVQWRNRLQGVGSESVLTRLAAVRLK